MTLPITGLHHVTSLASDAQANSDFFTKSLGLRRVKKTVNFDAPDVYHLYYGDEKGTPGSVMTYFPFPHIAKGRPGAGEVGETVFAIPKGSLGFWQNRLDAQPDNTFGEARLRFTGPDGDVFALVETDEARQGWTGHVDADHALRGFRGATLRLRDSGATAELLRFMGYQPEASDGNLTRWRIAKGNGADVIDVETLPGADNARQGGGSVHHIAFSVPDRAAQDQVRKALLDTGWQVTPPIDRDYFWAIYFRTPGGVLFEVATAEPGFDRDEDTAHLGEALKLPQQHERLRARLETSLQPITD
ncbi:VOC family protein [Paracoccus laeviglucosivorans]|uniref:Glyoxalase family protein n=1 Tax=Paracoccus laeviglucosivorans TaxID=1197861 RepID=A0A521ETH5_9RHOB|nr:VOC family protein [Paracoccus laeviglucosivorans]SMO86711.1 glyoxalase family protein [Paracoccus laeviglucosivorans]